jgi:hypothetical protein
MTPLPMIETSRATRDRTPSPLAFVLDRLFPKRERAPYAPLERLVVLAVVRAMSPDGAAGECNCFLSYPTIARWTGISLASVKRMLQRHCDGPAPLFYRLLTGQTRGRYHACYRFTLVRHPEQFAAARDKARTERRLVAQQALRALQPERLALQRQLQEFGGVLTHAEYRRRLMALERTARHGIPARATATRGSRCP